MLFKKSEEYHMKRINLIIKDCWHFNINDINSAKYIKKYLRRKKLNPTDHKFLIDFRNRINNIDFNNPLCKIAIDNLLKDFYKHLYTIESIKDI